MFCRTDEKHARDWPKPASSEIPPDNEPDIISQFSNCSKAPNANSETYTNYAKENAKDIIAIGGGTDKTFFHVNSSCMSSSMGEHLIKMKKVRATLRASILIYSHADGSAEWAIGVEILGCLLWF